MMLQDYWRKLIHELIYLWVFFLLVLMGTFLVLSAIVEPR